MSSVLKFIYNFNSCPLKSNPFDTFLKIEKLMKESVFKNNENSVEEEKMELNSLYGKLMIKLQHWK